MRHSTPAAPAAPRFPGLTQGQRLGLLALLMGFICFGLVVEFRAAFLTRHMTDLQVYLRAAWAVRTGNDFYAVTDDNHWHYHYPPLFAILLVPLADAPPQAEPLHGAVPFALSVGLWYVFSLACLAFGVHWLANALEETDTAASGPPAPRFSRRWWALRVLPILACLASICCTLMRGQVNLLVLAVLCGMLAAAVRGRSWRAGFWLAAAICLKVIPAFLLLYPLWRRDGRCLAGCAIGLFLGMGVIPAAVLGPERTRACYQEWAYVLVRPALGDGEDHSRAKELIETTATDSQSFVAILHNLLHWNRGTRPPQASEETRLAHWMLGGLMAGVWLLAVRWRRQSSTRELLGLSSLVLVMLLLSPVCHLHYFCLMVPLVMGLIWTAWQTRPPESGHTARTRLGLGLTLLLVANGVVSALPHIPGLEMTRDCGSAACGVLLLWVAAVVILCLPARREPVPVSLPRRSLAA